MSACDYFERGEIDTVLAAIDDPGEERDIV